MKKFFSLLAVLMVALFIQGCSKSRRIKPVSAAAGSLEAPLPDLGAVKNAAPVMAWPNARFTPEWNKPMFSTVGKGVMYGAMDPISNTLKAPIHAGSAAEPWITVKQGLDYDPATKQVTYRNGAVYLEYIALVYNTQDGNPWVTLAKADYSKTKKVAGAWFGSNPYFGSTPTKSEMETTFGVVVIRPATSKLPELGAALFHTGSRPDMMGHAWIGDFPRKEIPTNAANLGVEVRYRAVGGAYVHVGIDLWNKPDEKIWNDTKGDPNRTGWQIIITPSSHSDDAGGKDTFHSFVAFTPVFHTLTAELNPIERTVVVDFANDRMIAGPPH